MTSCLVRSLTARGLAALAVSLFAAAPVVAQRSLTAADYGRAERAMTAPAVTQLANSGRVTPNWLPGERFWYATTTATGTQFTIVNPAKKTKGPAFDHARVAIAISAAAGKSYDAMHLPFSRIAFTKDAKSILVNVEGKDWSCGINGAKCVLAPAGSAPVAPAAPGGGRGGRGGGGGRAGGGGATSPDGKLTAFIRDYNLWVRDFAAGKETQLTTDGVMDFGYATDNAGWASSPNAIVVWSPDSKQIATQQQDERGDGKMYLVTTPNGGANGTNGGHPVLRAWNYPLPGDSIITTIQRVIIDVATHKVTRLQMPPDQHRSIQGDDLKPLDVKWSPDGSRIVFASVSRDHKHVWIREANAATGAVRTIMEETSPTHVENWAGGWRVLWPTNEILWYSQRENFGRLYLYDLVTGKLKNAVTSGEGNVTAVNRLNDTTRVLWFTALGGEKGQNPYFAHHYRVNLDGTKQVSLDPDDGNHEAPGSSPSGKYFVDVWSQTDAPYASAVRDGNTGALVMALEKPADAAAMKAAGWNPVITIKMKGRDGVTDIYGQMERPSTFDPAKKYPIINYIYPGPQSGSVSGWGFKATAGESSGLSELGFIVVAINGMGTPGRDKKFMDTYYGKMGDNTLPDQVAGMKELAQRYPWIDIDKAGIWGHSGGGFATADAMFRYPDFFKVGIAESGNHDNRQYEDDWGERYQGLLVRNADGTDNYDPEANQNFAKDLKGHLLLAHGTMDNNVPPYNTLLIVDKLIAANKDFDLLLIPNAGHGYGAASSYMQRRRWDYFTRYLMGAEPPKEYKIGGGRGGAGGRGGSVPAGRGGGGGGY